MSHLQHATRISSVELLLQTDMLLHIIWYYDTLISNSALYCLITSWRKNSVAFITTVI